MNLELILIDDGSSDSSRAIIDDYKLKDNRIVTHHNQENMGLIKTLNKGVGLARGEFIARMDADDITAPDRIEVLLEVLKNNPDVSVVSAGYFHLSESGQIIRRVHPKACNTLALKYVSFFCTPINHPCMMSRASVLKENPFDELYIHSEDYEIFSRLLLNGHKFRNVDKPLYFLRKNSESVSFKFEKIQISTHTKISERNIEQYFGKTFDFFIHKIMINRISFNVTPLFIKQAIANLSELKKEFISREKPSIKEIQQINEFLVEQKIDILLQSIKYAYLWNKIRICLMLLTNIKILLSKRGIQYMRSKLRLDKR